MSEEAPEDSTEKAGNAEPTNSTDSISERNETEQKDLEKESGTVTTKKNKKPLQQMIWFARCLAVSSFMVEILAISITIWFFAVAFKHSTFNLFIFHPTLSVFAGICLMSFGMLEESGLAIFSRNLPGSQTTIHVCCMVGSTLCLLVAIVVIAINKINYGNAHFYSNHSRDGISACILSVISSFIGIVLMKAKNGPKYRLNLIKVVHYFVGIVTYYLTGATLCLSFFGPWFKTKFDFKDIVFGNTAVVAIFLFCSFKPFIVLVRRLNYAIRNARK